MKKYAVTPSQLLEEFRVCASANRVASVRSAPGVGKSSLVAVFAESQNCALIDMRLTQCAPEDLNGYPKLNGDKATFVAFDAFPLESDELPEGKNGWVLFLDEFYSASKSVQAAAYKLLLDRQVGSFRLHPKVRIIIAGNRKEDNAIVTATSTAIQSRVIHYELKANSSKDWIDWAIKAGIDYRIVGYINFKPTLLNNFDPKHSDRTYACQRTWHFLSDLIKGDEVKSTHLPRIVGTVGEGAAVEFMAYCKVYQDLPSMSEIIADPEGLNVPIQAGTRYALVTLCAERVNKENISKVLQYIQRLPTEFQVIFSKSAIARDRTLRDNKDFVAFIGKVMKYLSN